jgi:hypothetical protein
MLLIQPSRLLPLPLGNGCRYGQQVMVGLARLASEGTRQSQTGGQISEDAHRGEWLRYDGRRLVDSPLIQRIAIGMWPDEIALWLDSFSISHRPQWQTRRTRGGV